MKSSVLNKVILLDRDGVINKKAPQATYIKNWKEFIFLPGALEGLIYLTQKGYDIFIVTNQAGIGRGLMTEDDLRHIHEQFLKTCRQKGIQIKKIYYCPHNWGDGCVCRKPKPGMLLQSAKEYNFDITQAVFIGDDNRDKQAGNAAGCHTILMEANGSLYKTMLQYDESLL